MAVFLEPHRKIVHACKYNPPLAIGITRCGSTFLMGDFSFKPDYQFGAPENLGADGSWARCERCSSGDYSPHKKRWRNFKKLMRATLATIGVNVPPSDTTVETPDAIPETVEATS